MKLRVIPSVDELVEVLRPYLYAELSDDALRDVLETIASCGFEVSHEVEADDAFVTQLEQSLTDLREGRGVRMGRPVRTAAQDANARSQHVRWEPRSRADLSNAFVAEMIMREAEASVALSRDPTVQTRKIGNPSSTLQGEDTP